MSRAAVRIPDRLHHAVALLGERPHGRILEIGCGAGHAVALLVPRLADGAHVTAIDRSAGMVARAQAGNGEAITAGRVRVRQQTLEQAAREGSRYDTVFAVNVNAFWTEPARSLAALARLVKPEGRAVLVYEPPGAAQRRDLEARLPTALVVAGFELLDAPARASTRDARVAVIARPPATP
jgi:SAM-dependent methyltransferase